MARVRCSSTTLFDAKAAYGCVGGLRVASADSRDDRGFTLVELLVVVLMLGVLSSMALIGVQGAQRTSTIRACATDWQSIDAALQAYGLDHRSSATGQPDFTALGADALTVLKESQYLANAAVSDPARYRATVEVLPDGSNYAVWISDEFGTNSTALSPGVTRQAAETACSTAVGQ